MTVCFRALTSDAHQFPKAKVPILPVMNFGLALGTSRSDCPSRFMASDSLFLQSGRVALAHALEAAGVGRGDTVLIPAYHCVAMVEPALWLQADVVLYKLKPDLGADLQDIAEKLHPRAKALLLPHYFGFPQPLMAMRRLCSAHGVRLIEDCAHAFFGETEGYTLGSVGDFAIASTMKFFPGTDGGMLCANTRPLDRIVIRSLGPRLQLKALVNCIELAADYRRLGLFGRLVCTAFRVVHRARRRLSRGEAIRCDADGREATTPFRCFHPEELGQAGSLTSRLLWRCCNKADSVRRRRENYVYLLAHLRHVPHARPLFPELPQAVVPYVFPLLLERPERDFPALKARGVPIWRWEELAASDCRVSQQYRLRLLQLPCHQALQRWELDWIITTITAVLSTTSSGQHPVPHS